MSIPLYFTTTTAPPWAWTFADAQGNVPPNFLNATCTLTFRSLSTGQKVRGAGSFMPTNGSTGLAIYTLSPGPPTDLANVYAASALGINDLPGTELFELLAEATIGTNVYDGTNVPQIAIRKI